MEDFCSNHVTLLWNQSKEAGILALNEERWEEAEAHFREALQHARSLGSHDPRVVLSLNNLALSCTRQEHWADAENHYREALSILKKTQWHEHPDIATVYLNLGSLYQQQGRLNEAIVNTRRCYDLREFMYGPTHSSLARPLAQLGSLYLAAGGHLHQAMEVCVRALSIMEADPDCVDPGDYEKLCETRNWLQARLQESTS